jgi:hypothetical protein
MPYSGAGKVSDTTRVIIEGISMYDTVAPPKLIADTGELYKKLGDLLVFSSKLHYDEKIRIASYGFIVDADGRIQRRRGYDSLWVSPDIKSEMKGVMDFVLMNLTQWEAGFLKENPSKKIPFFIDVDFHFYRDKILFTVQGNQSYYFLRKAYSTKYLRGD